MADRLTPILDAVRTQVAALGFAVDGEVLPVLKRKAVARRASLEPARMITVAKSGTPEQTTRRRVGLWQTAYVIDVVVHAPYENPDDSARHGAYAEFRDRIVDVFKRPPLPGAPEVFDMDCQPADWLRPFGEQSDYDWWSCQITATVAHA